MGAMRVGEVACAIYLLRFQFAEQLHGQLHVFRAHGLLLYQAGFVEGQVLEMRVIVAYAHVAASGVRFTTADQPLNGADLGVSFWLGFLLPIKAFAFSRIWELLLRSMSNMPSKPTAKSMKRSTNSSVTAMLPEVW